MALPVLKLGSKGDNVKRLQKVLGIVADGNFGYGTRTAVMNFQKTNGLVADGVVGNLTWAKIIEKENGAKPVVGDKEYVYTKRSNGLHTVEIDGLKLKLVMEQTTGKKSKLKNLMNASFVWWTDYPKNTKAYPTSILIYDGKILRNAQPNGYDYQKKSPSYTNGVPTPVFIIFKNGNVKVLRRNSFTEAEANQIHLAVTGIDLLPIVSKDGFEPYVNFSSVAYKTMRVAIGYNPTTKKVVLAYRNNTTAYEMSNYMKSIGCNQAISIDSGGSANFDVEGKNINRTTRAMAAWITW